MLCHDGQLISTNQSKGLTLDPSVTAMPDYEFKAQLS